MNIVAVQLGKRFNREWVFRNLSLSLEPGNTYAIVGPNGCGKSTLLQILWAQLPQSVGTLTYQHNKKVVAVDEVFSHISIATPYMELIEEFTLTEMVAFHTKFKKLRDGLTVVDFIERLQLSHAKNKPINQFSSGMKQRLKLGLAFFSEVNCIFLDEPTTNLDKASTQWYLDNLASLPKEMLMIIASNQAHEYPSNSKEIEMLKYK
jgi:ABC-type multidrug transport system ATPase subunit